MKIHSYLVLNKYSIITIIIIIIYQHYKLFGETFEALKFWRMEWRMDEDSGWVMRWCMGEVGSDT